MTVRPPTMILNAYAILDAFACLVRLGLGVAVAGGGFVAWRSWRRRAAAAGDTSSAFEERFYLLFLLALVLMALNLAAWPLFYLLLQSYVPQWPGVMCIRGVTQVGAAAGNMASSRFLPEIVWWLEVLKPALVFATGAWACVYLLNRHTRQAPLTGAVLLGMTVAGVLAATDAGLESAYLVIPKQEAHLSVGCCSAASIGSAGDSDEWLPAVIAGRPRSEWIWLAAGASQAIVVLGLAACALRPVRPRSRSATLLLGVAALVGLATGMAFLREVAAPWLLKLPYHHCLYCLFSRIPEALVAAMLLVGSSFAVGWAGVTERWRNWPEVSSSALALRSGLLKGALWGYLAATAMLAIAMGLAL